MAKTKFSFKQKLEIKLPKVEGKAQTKKMQAAVNKAITRGAQKGATYVEKDLKAALDASISANVWSWPRATLRQNGSEAGTTRDIVDTGKLRNSLEIKASFSVTKVGFQINYKTPYAGLVHYGGVIKPYGNPNAADVLVPGRPWVQAIFEGTHGQPKFDIKTPFDKGISEVWSAQFGT